MQEILIPGKGLVSTEALKVDAAVKEYDELLHFGFNPANEDWCIYRKLPRDFKEAPYYIDGEPVIIVLGFQDKIPTPFQAVKRLWETDALRHGDALLKRMNAENECLKKEQDEKFEEVTQEVAERAEFALRQQGESPVVKVFFQKGRRR